MIYKCFFILLTLLLTAMPALASELPQAFDIRNINGASYIGEVRDQGDCGSCWSFGPLASAESTWNRARGLYDDEVIDLSEAFLVWSLSPLYDGMEGCYGGSLPDPFNAMLEYGAPLESDFPYPIDENWQVTDPGDNLHWNAPRYTMEDWHIIPLNDVETTRRVLHSLGAVAIAVHAGNDDFLAYEKGTIFDQSFQTPTAENIDKMDHVVSLVGWNDQPEDGGMGYWILRNSWSEDWGEDGYMNIRYLNAGANIYGQYFTVEPWSGESIHRVNTSDIDADTWSAGKTLNAHGIDLWGDAASSVINRGEIRAEAVSPGSNGELATARGIYLWGGPDGFVVNENEITAIAESENNQAFAYGTNLQGGRIENSGKITAKAQSGSTLAMSYGVWAANGGNPLDVDNSGEILARSSGPIDGAYGLWLENRGLARVTNTGTISAEGGDAAAGVVFNNGPVVLDNSGLIQGTATASRENGELAVSGGYGVLIRTYTYSYPSTALIIRNSGTISGSSASIVKESGVDVDLKLHLTTGSNLIGPVLLDGSGEDTLLLTGHGTEDEVFYGIESLVMKGVDWSLSGDSEFETIDIKRGRLQADGALSGQTTVYGGGILGGSGTLTGHVKNSGAVAPGNSVGHFTIDGDFEQTADGTLAIEVNNHSADLLTVTGSADLAGTLAVLPDGYVAGGAHTFLEANAIRGSFDSLETVAVLNAAMFRNPSGSLALAVTRNSYESLATAHNSGLAQNLDSIRASASGDMGDILDRLDLAADANRINANMAEMTPRIHGFASAATLDDSHALLSGLRRHTGQKGFNRYPNEFPSGKTAVWADIASDYRQYGATGGYFKTRKKDYGLMLGVARNTASSLSVGIAAAVTKSDYDSRNTRDQGKSETQQVYLYGSGRLPGKLHGLYLSGAIGAGKANLEAERAIAFAGRTARSDHDADIYSTSLEFRYPLHMKNWRISPALGVSYVHLREERFKESGAGSANLEIDARNDDSVQSHLGGRIERPLSFAGLSMTPALELEWRHEFHPDSEPLKSSLAGGGNFTTPGRDLAKNMLLLGASLKANISEYAYCNVTYDLEIQDSAGFTGHALGLQLGVRF